MPEVTADVVRDAARWNALMECGAMTWMGCAGFPFNKSTYSKEKDVGYRHMTINFFTHSGECEGRAERHNQCVDFLTELADIVRADHAQHLVSVLPSLPQVDYKAAFCRLVAAMRERKLASINGKNPGDKEIYYALQNLLVKYGDFGAVCGPMFEPLAETPNAES